MAEADKKANQKGKYFQPKAWGKSANMGINYISISNRSKKN